MSILGHGDYNLVFPGVRIGWWVRQLVDCEATHTDEGERQGFGRRLLDAQNAG